MIFLTIGTHEPFQRLVNAVDEWCGLSEHSMDVFGQVTEHGLKDGGPKNFHAVDRMSPADYAAKFTDAKLIVSHAGMGSIITALNQGKPIVVMPRRGHLRETRNDHQYTTVKKLGDRNGIFVAEDETTLSETLDRALAAITDENSARLSEFAQDRMTDALRKFILAS